ncbi:hypothetical protein HPB47_025248 [Ixodes persulcatus]|uniref:Uncharacterized protein n=1 Tax=Ixodes persulcatus TaxID=34615 RepID=A0AC60Q2R1_IXOPE|nr:hypothetical protein HPB47_025248 [Ixodes persulcatus]
MIPDVSWLTEGEPAIHVVNSRTSPGRSNGRAPFEPNTRSSARAERRLAAIAAYTPFHLTSKRSGCYEPSERIQGRVPPSCTKVSLNPRKKKKKKKKNNNKEENTDLRTLATWWRRGGGEVQQEAVSEGMRDHRWEKLPERATRALDGTEARHGGDDTSRGHSYASRTETAAGAARRAPCTASPRDDLWRRCGEARRLFRHRAPQRISDWPDFPGERPEPGVARSGAGRVVRLRGPSTPGTDAAAGDK